MTTSISNPRAKFQGKMILALALTLILQGIGFAPKTHASNAPLTIPALQQWTGATGHYTFTAGSRIVVDSAHSTQLAATGTVFADDLLQLTGFTIPVVTASSASAGDIFLTMGTTDPALKADGYLMDVTDRITINGKDKGGTFYGTRTVLQLLKQGYTIVRGSAKDWSVSAERTFLIDNGRKYYSPAFLKNRIREMAYLKYNVFQWHLSDNEGFRIESTIHPEIVSPEYLTKAEVADIIDFASQYNVTIVPQIDMPSHMGQILQSYPELQLTDTHGVKHAKIDLSLNESYTLMNDILQEYLPLFPGPYYHLAADEYLKANEYVNFPQLQAYAQAHYGPNATGLETFLGFINWANDIVKSYGKTMRVWNDSIQNSTIVPLATDIQVEYWAQAYLTPQDFINRGNTLINANSSYLYYVLGFPWKPDAAAIYQNFTPNMFAGATVSAAEPKNLGASLSVWSDNAIAESESQVELGIQNAMRAFAQKNWGSPLPAPDYSSFLPMINQIGSAPGYTGASTYDRINLSEGKTVTASSVETPAFTPDLVVDGDYSSRWASVQSDLQWIQVDLGAIYEINEIILTWEVAYGKVFQIQVSSDASNWTPVYTTTSSTGGTQVVNGLIVPGRYVRMYGTQRGTPYGYSLYEFQVYGTAPKPVQDAALQFSVTNSNTVASNRYHYEKFSIHPYVFKAGDYFEYDVKLLNNVSGAGGIEIVNTDGTIFRDTGWTDQNGVIGHPSGDISAYAYNNLYRRKLAVPASMVGKTASFWAVAGENDTASLSYTALYDYIRVTNSVFANAADYNASGTVLTAGVASGSVTTPSGDTLQIEVTNDATSTSNRYRYEKFSNKAHVFQAGDYIEYDVKLLNNVSGSGGIEIMTTDGTVFRDTGWTDQNGVNGHPGADLSAYASNVWHHRIMAVPSSMVGKTAAAWMIAAENDTASLNYTAQYRNIKVANYIFNKSSDHIASGPAGTLGVASSSVTLVPHIP